MTLARQYRRLLLCYPRQYRRARGEEIVATLLDLAGPDRVRPTVREAGNLVRHGLRCRLGRPDSRTVVLWAALTAVAWGLFTGAFATRLAWETARPLPSQAAATDLFTRVLGQDTAGQVGVDPAQFVVFGQPLGWHNLHVLFSPDAGEYQQGRAMVSLNGPVGGDRRSLLDATRARLLADGWHLTRVQCTSCDPPQYVTFTARRGDDVLSLEFALGDQGSLGGTYAHIDLTRATPPLAYPFGVLGVLLGVAFGWLAFGWASRRAWGLRALTTTLYGIAVFAWYAPIALAFPVTVANQRDAGGAPWPPMWKWLGQPDLAVLFVLGTGAALVALALCALPRRAPEPPEPIAVR
jgi:hypothetical protein